MLFFKFTGLYKKINFVFLYKSSSNRKWKIKSKNTSLKKTKKGLWVKVYQVEKKIPRQKNKIDYQVTHLNIYGYGNSKTISRVL